MNRTIEIVISPTGQVTVKARGFVGSSCRDATKSLEEALGKATNEQLTAEFYECHDSQQQSANEG